MADRQFTVSGRWPFPLDMLRYDEARAASPRDQELINQLSATNLDETFLLTTRFEIHLVCPRRVYPTTRRWESFMWRVVGL